MKPRFAPIFLVITAASSLAFLLTTGRAFRSLDPVAIFSAIWTILLIGIIGIALRRMAQPATLSRSGRSRSLGFILFGVHSLLIAGWFAWASYRESQHSVGGWAATILLHYTLEVPTSGACWLVESIWRRLSGHGPRIVWFYPVYFVVGGTFYALLPTLFRGTAQQNATNVA